MRVKLCERGFDPWQEIALYQAQLTKIRGKYGATGVFVGTMRDFNADENVQSLYLEHYPEMCERQLARIIEQATAQWAVMDVLLVHRVGELKPNEPIVLIAVWSSHRGDALDCCRYLIETLKAKAPFWKRETLTSGEQRWIRENSNGYA